MVLDLGAFMLARPRGDNTATLPPLSPKTSATPEPTKGSSVSFAAPAPVAAPVSPTRHGQLAPVYADRTTTEGPYNAKRLAAVVPRHSLVDFGYMDLVDIKYAASTEPRAGVRVSERANKKANAAAKKQAQSATANAKAPEKEGASRDGTAWIFGQEKSYTERTGDGFLVVRAGEETYAFKDEEEMRREMRNDPDANRFYIDAEGQLRERPSAGPQFDRFYCTSIKLDHNGFQSSGLVHFSAVMNRILVDPLVNLTCVDLSFNALVSIPPVDAYPLQTLLLHCNNIQSLDEVKKLQNMHRTLKKLSLNENPVQLSTKKYKYAVLHQLPFLQFLDDTRVTDKDRERIAVFEELFVPVSKRGLTRKFLPPLSTSPTPGS